MSKADIKLPSVFGDRMILQQNTNARIWGEADAHESITIITSWGNEQHIKADDHGQWSVEVPTPSGSHTPQQIILKGKNEVYLRNVLIGEVWLCSGQSNMGWSVKQSNNSYEEIKKANYPSIRFFHVPNTMAWEPQPDVNAQWEVCTPETAATESAVAYFFGRELLEKLDVPVGLIVSAWGGSGAQAWIDKETAGKEGHQDIVDWYDKREQKLKQYRFEWIKAAAEWRAKQKDAANLDWDSRPKRNLPGDNHIPFVLYNGMINPIKTYTLKGALWYQGESNVARANQYRTLFPAMIKSWRNAWDQGDFPFYYVQLAPYHYNEYDGIKSAELRDAQLKTLDMVKHTGMVVTTDIGNSFDIHPRKKQEVGHRLAMLALHNDYGKLADGFSSPFLDSYQVNGNKVVISFKHAKELKTRRGSKILGLTIAGKDQKFVDAQAEIVNGNQLKVWSDKIKRPVAVRFGWSNAPFVNLFNEANLPLSPFKTDNWKDSTEGNIHLDFPE
ncbi:sialate O-acetylesterase [Fulvivirgaceae bacterium BMA10]|uniref:Sialate O-acetylesterase n=1 Tax=Splendidivirga corallicola TaxID=3051826 RepID=A0ABT8KUW2_9BACT|nr:sialate O-acetylesterase [Fulvivirgaceae bacterium BMA10]